MSVTFTNTKAALAAMATELAARATASEQTSLATALTNLASEIGQSVTEEEFFGGTESVTNDEIGSAALVWTSTLSAAAATIDVKYNAAITGSQTSIAASQVTIAAKQTLTEDHIHDLRDLGHTVGIRIKSPYENFNTIAMYNHFIEQGKLNDTQDLVSLEERQAAIAKIPGYIAKLADVKDF